MILEKYVNSSYEALAAYELGHQTYLKWSEQRCKTELPENPYPKGSKHYDEWEQGFSDAEEYVLRGQYISDEENKEES